ncbi:peptide transporter family 1 isoform X2 [Lasioglossum baleicum]|uniref:peptide transporter family 1 isoform X2 n=1 Tax=Lasioglossum baleicum TaxID=434251 RepID=UPI003FCE60A6
MLEKREGKDEKLKYPKSIFFIVSNEFCERFSFYGMRTVLTLYLKDKLKYGDNSATAIFHAFVMMAYFFPLMGAILADSWLGKFRTIFYLSILYAIGQILLTLTAAPIIGLPPVAFSFVGLILIAFGTGGIKPCVVAFGGDQFTLPQQARYLSTFFSIFYFSINFGSLISSFLTPLLRSNVTCFEENSCYSLAFLVPAILMTLSIVIFVLGRPLYKIKNPTNNAIVDVTKCISHAIYMKTTSTKKRDHWLEYADDKYDKTTISDIRDTLQVMKLFIPIPIFWALFDQQGSRWTIQASRMDGQIGSWLLHPDQMIVINPLLVLALIPLFETCIYPLMTKIGLNTPLKKLTIGGMLTALAFVVSGFVELKLEETYPVLPSQGLAQVRLFNTLNCPIDFNLNGSDYHIDGLQMWAKTDFKMNIEKEVLPYRAVVSNCSNINVPTTVEGTLYAENKNATSWMITEEGLYMYYEEVQKSSSGNPLLRPVIWTNRDVQFQVMNGEESILSRTIFKNISSVNKTIELRTGTYDFYLNNKKVKSNVELKLGGVYSIVGHVSPEGTDGGEVNVNVVTDANSMHILWLVPQYVLLTLGEVMFSVTGLEFAFTQAPTSMKSILQAAWQLTVAVGNLIVIIIAEASLFDRQMYEFFLFAGLMFVDIIAFAVLTRFYTYVQKSEEESITEEEHTNWKNGTANESYKDDEK